MDLIKMSNAELDVLFDALAWMMAKRASGELPDYTDEQHDALTSMASNLSMERWARGLNT